MAKAFSISRITAKRAFDELSAEGLVERRRAKGTHLLKMTRVRIRDNEVFAFYSSWSKGFNKFNDWILFTFTPATQYQYDHKRPTITNSLFCRDDALSVNEAKS